MKLITIAVLTVCVSWCGTAQSFDLHTHVAMTAKAAEKSALGVNPASSAVISRLGLTSPDAVFGRRYIGFALPQKYGFATNYEGDVMLRVRKANSGTTLSIPDDFSITGWIMRGAVREDDNEVETARIGEVDPVGAPVFNRVFGHFFDPVNNVGLRTSAAGARGPTAQDWATDPAASIPRVFGSNDKNYFNSGYGREAMWRALTLTTLGTDGLVALTPIDGATTVIAKESERRGYWKSMFRTLGDLVHLVQDMAQPQHARDDRHSGLACVNPDNPDATCLGGHASFIENYFYARTVLDTRFRLAESRSLSPPPPNVGKVIDITSPQLPYDGYDVPKFATYRDFFATGTGNLNNDSGRGLANYTNRGFYSAGTNINNTSYLSPPPSGGGLGVETILAPMDGAGVTVGGAMRLRTGTVSDFVTNIPVPNVRLSAEGFWDQFLENNGNQPRFTLNYYNYDAQADLLIPRAVAYSAGLIDYFFRGQLDVTPPDEGVYSVIDHSDRSGATAMSTDAANGFKGFKTFRLKLRNATPDITPSGTTTAIPQTMSGGKLVGVLKFYRNLAHTDDLAGEPANATAYRMSRSAAEEIVVSSRVKDSAGGLIPEPTNVTTTAQTYQFEFDQEIPINAIDIKLQVVYRGALGSEADAVVVETVDVSEPSYVTYLNSSDYIQLGNNVYTRSQVNETPALLSQVRPTTFIDSMTGQLKNTSLVPIPLNFDVTFGSIGNNAKAVVALPFDKTYHRLALLIPPGGNAFVDWALTNSGCGYNAKLPVTGRVVQTNYNANPAGDVITSPLPTTRGTRSWASVSCILNGDNLPHPDLLTETQNAAIALLQGDNLKPLKFSSFTFGTP